MHRLGMRLGTAKPQGTYKQYKERQQVAAAAEGGGMWDTFTGAVKSAASQAGQALGQQLSDPNSFLRTQGVKTLTDSTAGTKYGKYAGYVNQANDTAKKFGYGRLPRAKPRWSERTRAKHAFMKSLSKAGVPLAKLSRAAAAALADHERGSSMEVSIDTGMKAVGM